MVQYGWGASIDENEKAKHAVETSRDLHYVEGLKEDTCENRPRYFITCTKKLTTLPLGHKDVEKIIIPEGMGCRGKGGDEWQNHYLPAIEALALRLKPFCNQTVVTRLPE